MFKGVLASFIVILFTILPAMADQQMIKSTDSNDAIIKVMTDNVIRAMKPSVPALFTGVVAAPSPMCNIVAYALCNYIVPPNDYVSFQINNGTGIDLSGTCPAANLNTVTLTFEVAPNNPIFVWLTGTAGVTPMSTPPVYMNTASTIISKSTTAMATWFDATTTWTNLCVQAIYSDPPPSTLYYPMSCTIVYQ
mgnify:FL=1